MKKITFIFALLCASVMGWAYTSAPDTWIGTTDATYANQFKWSVLSEVATPNDVVNIQQPGFASAIGIYMTFADAAFDGVYMNGTLTTNGTEYKQDGAGIVVYLSALTAKNTEVLIKQGSTTRFGLNIYNDKGTGGGDPDPGSDPGEDPEPDPNDYTAGGHTIHLEVYYVNDIYTLNITSTDAMEGLGGSFWYVNGASTDMRSNAGTSSYTVSGDKKTITCQVQSTSAPSIHTPLYVLMPGEVNFGDVTLNWEDRTPINSEYCNYQGTETLGGGTYITLTWETDGSGNVVITMGNGTGTSSCSFRNGGFEGGIDAFIVSTDDFVTSEAASNYFTASPVYSGNTYTLTKIADLPANAKIKHVGSGHALAWVANGNNQYTFPDFIYTYGGTCNQLDAPTNVAIDGTNHITFDAVAGADSYRAYVSLGGVEKYSQAVASGDELTFVPLVTGDYIVNVIASGAGKVDSDPSADLVWHLEAAPVVLGNSEYCETHKSSGSTEAAFTWETDADGNIVITISEVLSGPNAPAHFRANAFKDGIKVGASKESLSTYFNIPATIAGGDHSKTSLTYTLIDPANAPALGEKIYYNGTVEYRTSENTDAWPTLNFEWTYGTVCSGFAVSASVNNNTMGSAVVKVGEDEVTNVDEDTEVSFIATVADAELYRFVNWTKGGVVVSTNATYVTTITETTNLVANFDYVRDGYCHYELLATGGGAVGKKLYMTLGSIGGGKYQIKYEGSAEAPLLGLNNANYVVNGVSTDIEYEDQKMSGNDVPFSKQNGRWSFDATGYGSAKMEFSLADGKTIDDIYVWENNIYFNTSYGELAYQDNNDRHGLFGMNAAKRHNIDWEETCSDAIAPVFDKAEAEVLNETSVRLTIQATDNWGGLLTYTIAREAAEPIISNHASGEEFTQDVTGLTAGTEYTFTVTVSDGVNNTNQNIVVTPVADENKPVMGAASLESKTWNSAIINVAATDDKGVVAYRIVELAADFAPAEDKITVEGLTAATAYTFTIKAKDAAGNISDGSAEVSFTTYAHALVPATPAPVPSWPADQVKSIYSDAYALAPANTPNYNAPWWQAPAINLSDIDGDHFMDYDLENDGMIGWQYDQISVASMEKIHIDIFASAAGTVTIRPITQGDPEAVNNTRKTLTLVAQQWNSFDVELSEFGAHDWTKLFQFSIEYWLAGGLLGEHISVDNVYFYRTTAIVDNDAPTEVSASLTATGFYSVKITAQAKDNSDAVNFKVMNGENILATGAAATNVATTITVDGLASGTNYNFNVVAYDEAGNEAEPVVVAAATKFMPAPAPAPNLSGKNVVNVFSDAIAGSKTIHSGGWGESTIAQWIDIAPGDKVFYAQNFNWAGWHSWGDDIDATNMVYLHVDVYSVGMTSVSVTPISHDPTHEGSAAIALTPNAWTSADIPLSAYPTVEWNKIFQFKFMNAVGGNEFMVDNVYFWQPKVTTSAEMGGDETTGGWATFSSAAKVAVPSGMKAYKAAYSQTAEEEVLTLTEVSVIPAGAGVILRGAAGADYAFALSTADDPDMDDNSLVGCPIRTDVSSVRANKDIFCMRYSESFSMTGFFLYEGQYVPAGKAYLALSKPSQPSSAPRKVRFVIKGEQTTTGVENADSATVEAVKFIENGQLFIRRGEAVYNLQGVRVK